MNFRNMLLKLHWLLSKLYWSLGYQARTVGPQTWKISRSEIEEYANTEVRPGWVARNYLFCSESD